MDTKKVQDTKLRNEKKGIDNSLVLKIKQNIGEEGIREVARQSKRIVTNRDHVVRMFSFNVVMNKAVLKVAMKYQAELIELEKLVA